MKNKITNGWRRMALVSLLASGSALATDIKVSVTVIAPPHCTVNGGKAILVDFGTDLVTTRVNGNNYVKTVDYTLDCRGNSRNAMKMRVVGTATDFNRNALQTQQSNLGIELRANGQPLAINGWLNFTYPNAPTLQAVPVKRNNSVLNTGSFSAGATLMVDYQ
ncbi:fimbrial protein [Serratia plymuthica]|uniref:fimbrial protein n=1 Tax=Serratia plymuthica TaxID=82996 RepID=UPI00201E52E0|nr:fimbrial protein [Serratia plymuthica]